MRMRARVAGLISIMVLLVAPVPGVRAAPPQGPGLPAASGPAFVLRRAVNIETWFRWNTDVAGWDDYMSDGDIGRLRRQGFGSVRLSLFPQYFLAGDGSVRMGRWGHVDLAIDRLRAAGLTVVVDLHSEGQVWGPFHTDADYRARYIDFVGNVAALVADRDPRGVALSLFNEPHGVGDQWNTWQRQLYDAARAAAPDTTLVLTSAGWGSVSALLNGTTVIDDPNLIWDVHIYDPFAFTHAGAPFVGYPERAFRRVPYPSTPTNVVPAIRASCAVAPAQWHRRIRRELQWYGEQRWRRARYARLLDRLADWSADHQGATLWIGEFGVNNRVRRRPAYRWWRHVRSEAEERGIAWATWFWWDWANRYGQGPLGDQRLAAALGLNQLG